MKVRILVLSLGFVAACGEVPVTPELPLPVVSVTDSLAVTYAFKRPDTFSPYDVGPPSSPAVRLEGQTLVVAGLFYLPEGDVDQYERMSANAVRVRHYRGAEPLDSLGAIHLSVYGGPGSPWPAASGADYITHLHGMMPGRYQLTVELEGRVYDPGLLLDSIIVVP